MAPLARWSAGTPRAIVTAGIAVILCVMVLAQTLLRFSGADRGFRNYTGVSLPPGVGALGHGSSAWKDPLFHTTHYWLLDGPSESLRALATAFKMHRSDEDARAMMPDMQKLFGVAIPISQMTEGYAGSADKNRDRWLVILANGRGAVFATP
jgi:hypothetical protein